MTARVAAFQNLVEKTDKGYEKSLCHEVHGKTNYLLHTAKKCHNYQILIGPEGDFTDDEIQLAARNDFQMVSLGDSRLRTETAGFVACTLLNALNIED